MALRAELAELLTWIRDLPTLPRRNLDAARTAAVTALKAARAAGFELRLHRFSAKALKRADTARDLRFAAMNEAAAADDPEYRLELTLDEALNGRKIPRRWLTRVDVPEGRMRLVPARHLA